MNELGIISSGQIKAARALLDWSQDDLANETNLSIATIRKLELGHISPRCSTTSVIRKVFENSGIEFLDSEGVRRRQEDVAIFQGIEGRTSFMEDMEQTTRKNGGEIMIVVTSALNLYCLCGAKTSQLLEDMATKNNSLHIKVILTDNCNIPVSMPQLEYRYLSTNYVDPMPFCVYGDKYAMLSLRENRVMKIVSVQSASAAQSSRRQFHSMWEKATTVYPASATLFIGKEVKRG